MRQEISNIENKNKIKNHTDSRKPTTKNTTYAVHT